MRQQNFVVSETKVTKLMAFNMEDITVKKAVFHLSISLSISEIYAIKD